MSAAFIWAKQFCISKENNFLYQNKTIYNLVEYKNILPMIKPVIR